MHDDVVVGHLQGELDAACVRDETLDPADERVRDRRDRFLGDRLVALAGARGDSGGDLLAGTLQRHADHGAHRVHVELRGDRSRG